MSYLLKNNDTPDSFLVNELILSQYPAFEDEVLLVAKKKSVINITFNSSLDDQVISLLGMTKTLALADSNSQVLFSFKRDEDKRFFDKSLSSAEEIQKKSKKKNSLLEVIGKEFLFFISEAKEVLCFIQSIATYFISAIGQPKLFRFKEFVSQIDQTGFGALSITILINALIGVVITYLMGNQLRYYGANIFVVDGVSITMCRELAPILVAIIVAGRSGSAFAAELGSMRLYKEIEALQVMGISPLLILVIPRILALAIVMPILVVIGDISGILGGAFISFLYLDVHPVNFFERLNQVLVGKHIAIGIFKAPLFALFIAAIGCRLGLYSEPNATSIGKNTTKTVVHSIISIIILNALIAVLLSHAGI